MITSFVGWSSIQTNMETKSFLKIGAMACGIALLGKIVYGIYQRSVADQPFPHIPPNLSKQAKSY